MQRAGDMTPRMMVLGMVVQEPGTVADVGRRLADQFAAAAFPRNSVHTNLPSLAAKGFVRLVKEGSSPSLDQYEATPDGVAHLREWLRRSAPPAIRDVLQGKLEFLELEDVEALLRAVREDEAACRSACDQAHGNLLTHKRVLRRRGDDPVDWRERLRLIQLEDAAVMWGTRAQRLERLAEDLEHLLHEAVPPGR